MFVRVFGKTHRIRRTTQWSPYFSCQCTRKNYSENFRLFPLDIAATACYYIEVVSNTEYRLHTNRKMVIMLENLTELLKGVLEGCVLEIISRKETYGYEITRQLNELGFTDIVDGTVYTILVRLEKNKLVNIEKKPSDIGPPRKFYTLNDAGREEHTLFWRKWAFVSEKINSLREDENNVKNN